MKIVSFTEARNGLKAFLDGVVNDADTTIITRRDSEDAVDLNLSLRSWRYNLVESLRLSEFDTCSLIESFSPSKVLTSSG